MDWGTYEDKFKFFITNSLGENLEIVFKDSFRRFKQMDTLKIGIQLLKTIEKVHNIGYIHGDIRPGNIVIP